MKKCIILLLLFFAIPAFAANTTGYAWSESFGWFDFSNATVSDTAVTGYAYNDNTGWLVLDGVKNTNGTLSGYAWSESVGWFDFSHATIQGGVFKGYGYNDNTGWLSFATGTNVATTWAPAVTIPVTPPISYSSGSSGGGSSYIPVSLQVPTTLPAVNMPTTTPSLAISTIVILTNSKKDLKINMTSSEVRLLQQFLNSQGFKISIKGAGSPGLESDYFGNLTKLALIRFQSQNKIKPASGYFGSITKSFIKTLQNKK